MNRYLVKLGSLDEKRAYPGSLQNPQNPSKRGFEGFEGPLGSDCLRSATPRTEAEPIPRREMAAGLYNWSQSDDGYASALAALRATCPVYVPEDRWRQAIADATLFISEWGGQAQAFGWTARELFGLHTPPERPAASYCRLSRYDETGLIWLLRGRPVIALTETTAAIQAATGVLSYRKLNKPTLGPLGDSLDGASHWQRDGSGRTSSGTSFNRLADTRWSRSPRQVLWPAAIVAPLHRTRRVTSSIPCAVYFVGPSMLGL